MAVINTQLGSAYSTTSPTHCNPIRATCFKRAAAASDCSLGAFDSIPFRGTLRCHSKNIPVQCDRSSSYNFDHSIFYLPMSFDTGFGLHGSFEVIFIPISVLVVCRA